MKFITPQLKEELQQRTVDISVEENGSMQKQTGTCWDFLMNIWRQGADAATIREDLLQGRTVRITFDNAVVTARLND